MSIATSGEDTGFDFIEELCASCDDKWKRDAQERFLLYLKDTEEVFERIELRNTQMSF
jgi:hypothetical protein